MSFGKESAGTLEAFVKVGTVSLGVCVTFREEMLLDPLRMWIGLGLGKDLFLGSARALVIPSAASEASTGTPVFSPEALAISESSPEFSLAASAGASFLDALITTSGSDVSGGSLRISSRTLVSSSEVVFSWSFAWTIGVFYWFSD